MFVDCDITRNGICTTDCPFGHTYRTYGDDLRIAKVGSTRCKECNHYEKTCCTKKQVMCSHSEDKNVSNV
jgi:hypothetical protein